MRIALMFALALAAVSALADDGPAIEDNSFLIEEAYNQDPRTVQHIFTYTRLRDGSWAASFTQEWPLGGQKHQGSYSLVTDRSRLAGAEINYRYQLYGGDNTHVAIAPRLSYVLPVNGSKAGIDAMFPVSVIVNPRFYTHYNLGVTHTDDTRTTAGFSAIYVVQPKLHAMLEMLAQHEHETTVTISPGVRWAYDFKSGLQIVPGIAVPITVRPSHERAVLLYLSFEHPY
jgi:hypothetical protein